MQDYRKYHETTNHQKADKILLLQKHHTGSFTNVQRGSNRSGNKKQVLLEWCWLAGFVQDTRHTCKYQGLFKDFPAPNLVFSRTILF